MALVTGGGSGIGRAVALRLAHAGANVVITGRREAVLQETCAQHPAVTYIVGDVSRDADRTLAEVERRHGRLDLLVNNAAVAPAASLERSDEVHVRSILEVNVLGVVETTRSALRLLRESRGTIVNITSLVGDMPLPGHAVYCASKAAVTALTRSWAKELAADGIRVNAVSPGPIDTPALGSSGVPREDLERMAVNLVALGRLGHPEEVAQVVDFLASPAASFVTGARYTVGGGMEA